MIYVFHNLVRPSEGVIKIEMALDRKKISAHVLTCRSPGPSDVQMTTVWTLNTHTHTHTHTEIYIHTYIRCTKAQSILMPLRTDGVHRRVTQKNSAVVKSPVTLKPDLCGSRRVEVRTFELMMAT